MIRLTLLAIFLVAIGLLSTARRWFDALCLLLLLTVISQHPDIRALTEQIGIQFVNPWNVALAIITAGWLMHRRGEPAPPPLPGITGLLLFLYCAMIIISALATVGDMGSFRGEFEGKYTSREVLVDTIANPLKYLWVGVLFYDGAHDRARIKRAVTTAIFSGMCYSLLMFKTLREQVFTINYLQARKVTDKLIGLFANDMAKLLAFTLWASIFVFLILDKRWQRALWSMAALLTIPAFLALKSRAGFLACGASGLALGVLRWRLILLIFPIAALVVLAVDPTVTDRIMMGVDTGPGSQDWNTISAGRTTFLWPSAMETYVHSPIWGFGRWAIIRTDCHDRILERGGRTVPHHPHNSYLEILLDAGAIGLLICLACMTCLIVCAYRLMHSRGDPLVTSVGAIAMIGCVSELAAGVAGSSFYATQSTVPVLCVWGLAVRMYAELRFRRPRPRFVGMSAAVEQTARRQQPISTQ